MLLLHRPVHRLHEPKSLRIVAIAVLAQKRFVLLLRGKLVVMKLAGGIEPETIDEEFFDPVKQRRDEETFHLITSEIKVRSAPGRVPALGDGTLEQIHIVVVTRQASRIVREVDQHRIENDADAFAME